MKILLVQTSFLGDVILSTPVITAILAKHDNSELWLMTTPGGAELLAGDTRLKGIITFDKNKSERNLRSLYKKIKELKAHKFDLVYSLHRSLRTTLLLFLARIPIRIGFEEARLSILYTQTKKRKKEDHEVTRNLSILSPLSADIENKSDISIAPPSPMEASRILEKFKISKPFTVVAPGSVWPTKRWSWQGYRKVVNELSSKFDQTVVVVGSEQEQEIATLVANGTPAINLCGQTTLAELKTIFSAANLVICNDSMSLHLASAFKIPNVAIFCATSPTFGFGPWRNRAIIVERKDLVCKPCSRHGGNTCPTGTQLCMDGLDSDKVISGILEVTS